MAFFRNDFLALLAVRVNHAVRDMVKCLLLQINWCWWQPIVLCTKNAGDREDNVETSCNSNALGSGIEGGFSLLVLKE
jgi:hypothetical protein